MKNDILNKEKTSISHSTSIVGNIISEEHLVLNGTVKGNIEINKFSPFKGVPFSYSQNIYQNSGAIPTIFVSVHTIHPAISISHALVIFIFGKD